MTTTELTTDTAIDILVRLLRGQTCAFIAADLHMPLSAVREYADEYADQAEIELALTRLRAGDTDYTPGFVDVPPKPKETSSTAADPNQPESRYQNLDTDLAGHGPYIDAVPAANMFADPAYQRDLNPRRVAKMVTEFDVTQVGVLEVSARPDGRYAIIEGQHRWAAALEAHPGRHRPNGLHLPCNVHTGLTVEDEADLFYKIDRNRKALSGWDRWKARRGSGDPAVVAIEATVAQYGLRIDPAPADRNIGATVALERIVEVGDLVLLARTLDLVTTAYSRIRDSLDGQILHGLALILANYDDPEEISIDQLILALQSSPPSTIKSAAMMRRAEYRGELPRLVAAVVIDRYNAIAERRVEPLLQRLPASSKIGGSTARKVTELARIRRWAIRNGHKAAVGGSNEIPRVTVEAYRRAHASAEAS
jgi:hypothetical protein